MSDENRLPPLMTPEEQMMESIRPYLLDPREDYPEPYYMLEFNGIPFSTLGGIQALSGQKKNGKTFVLVQLMAAILGQESDRIDMYLPGLKVPERTIEHIGHLPKVLYVDTEMEKLNSAKVLRRVHWLCGWDMKEPNERLNVLWLRTVKRDEESQEEAYQKRFRLIKYAIETLTPDIVFIDGIRDIIGDFNDNQSSAALVNDLMEIAQSRNICIWNALHLNPRPGNDDESKMRGHLGTELGNKVSDTLVSIKAKSQTGVTFTVKQNDARGKDLEDWQFEIVDDAGALGIPKIVSNGMNIPIRDKDAHDDPDDILAWINEALSQYEWPMSQRDIKKNVFGGIGKQKNKDKQDADLKVAKNLGYLVESTLKKNGYYMLQPPEDLPF